MIGSYDDADGNLTSLETADDRETVYEYDALDRLKTITDRLGKDADFTYDKLGHELTRKDRNSNTTTTVYDGLYRRTSVTDPLSHVTEFQYDEVGNLTRLRAVNGAQNQDTIYVCDRANRRTQEKYPTANCSPPVDSGDVRTYTYNGAGRLATRTDQNGDVTTYSYDDLHRLTGRSYSRGGSSVSYPTTQGADSFAYDRAGRMTSTDHVQGSDTFTLDFEYDAAGRLTAEDQDGFDLAYAYAVGPTNHYVQTTYSNARTVKHNFDARGRVSLITTTTQSVTTTQATNDYDDDNRLLSRAFGNGTTATWTYDDEDRIATLKHHCPSCGSGSSATDFIDLTYVRDPEGNPLSCKHNHAATTSELYAYDAADRLVDFKRGTLNGGGTAITGTPSEARRWTLDALGNWSNKQKDVSGTLTVNENRTHRIDNALTAIGSTSLTYDGPGNLKDDGTYLYDYDCENRLTRVRLKGDGETPPILIGEYGYNALGWRVTKTVSNSGALNGTSRMIYNQSWQLLEIRTVSGGSTTVAKQFLHAGPGVSDPSGRSVSPSNRPFIDDHIAMLTPSGGGWTAHYYHTDDLFNTLAMSDGSAGVAERAQFDPYGMATLADSGGSPISSSALGNSFIRQGTVRDWEYGNDENRHRSYAAMIGRWAQRDPLYTAAASVMLANEFEHAPASFVGSMPSSLHSGPQVGPGPCGGNGPTEPGAAHSWPGNALAMASRHGSDAEVMWASRSSQLEISGGNPLRWADPNGLSFSDPIFTGPELYRCCLPIVTRTGPFCDPNIDAGWRTITHPATPCCCGQRQGTRVCTGEHHFVAGRCTYIITTTYVKDSSTYCQLATCPDGGDTYDFVLTPPHPDGQVRNIQCTVCACAADP